MKERMKVLIAYDSTTHVPVVINELRQAGLPPRVEAIVLSVARVDLPSLPDQGLAVTSSNDRLDTLIRARAQAFYEVIMKERNRALFAVKDVLEVTRQVGEQIQVAFPNWTVEAEAYAASPALALLNKAEDWGADLIVIEAEEQPALERFILDSLSQKVVHNACCSVRVARQPVHETKAPVRLLVGLDGSTFAEKAVQSIAQRTWPTDSEVRLVTVKKPIGRHSTEAREQLVLMAEAQQTAATALRKEGLKISSVIKEGEAKSVLLAEAESWEADCIFVGARGLHSPLKRLLLGSVSAAIVTHAKCSVEVVR